MDVNRVWELSQSLDYTAGQVTSSVPDTIQRKGPQLLEPMAAAREALT